MKNVLFVCTGNSCRSVMAEGLFKAMTAASAGEFIVGSAGISALDGFASTPETIRVMAQAGIDVSQHKSRRLSLEMIRAADKIYVMEALHKELILRLSPQAKEKVALLSEFATERRDRSVDIDIPDPIRMSDEFYQNVFSVIEDCVGNLVEHLKGSSA